MEWSSLLMCGCRQKSFGVQWEVFRGALIFQGLNRIRTARRNTGNRNRT